MMNPFSLPRLLLRGLHSYYQRTHRHGHRGSSLIEFVIALPVVLSLGLGTMQLSFVYNAKNVVKYATFEAARKGAVNHGLKGPMREALGIRIAPLFGGDGTTDKAALALYKGDLEAKDNRYTKIEILNPTKEAFEDFGKTDEQGVRYIPVDHLKSRPREPGAKSGVTIQDATLLKIKVTYAYELKVPFINALVLKTLSVFDKANARYYAMNRIPVVAVATVRMQNEPHENGNVSLTGHSGGGGQVPPASGGAEPGNVEPDPTQGQGGNTGGSSGGSSGNNAVSTDTTTGTNTDTSTGSSTDTSTDTSVNTNTGSTPGSTGNSVADSSGSCSSLNASCNDLGNGQGQACVTSDAPAQNLDAIATVPGDASTGGLSTPPALPNTLVGNPINLVTGNKFQEEQDIAPLPGPLSLGFSRYYNSSHSRIETQLGKGWRHSFQLQLLVQDQGIDIIQSDGRRVLFRSRTGKPPYQGVIASDGVVSRFDNDAVPYLWQKSDGRKLFFNPEGMLVRMVTATGSALQLTYDRGQLLRQVKDDQRRVIGFQYYPNGRLKQVFDPAGLKLRYRYDAHGNLVSVEDRAGNARRYHYEDKRQRNLLTGRSDALGVRIATYAYDEQGRAIVSEHSGGVGRVSLHYADQQTTVTDSLGNQRIYHSRRQQGVPIITAIEGAGCQPCGLRADPNGGHTNLRYEYNEQLQLIATHYQNGRIEEREYDAAGRLRVERTRLTPTGSSNTSDSNTGNSNTGAASTQAANNNAQPRVVHQREYSYDDGSSAQQSALQQTTQQPKRITQPSIVADKHYTIDYRYNRHGQITQIDESGWRWTPKGNTSIQRCTALTYNEHARVATIDGPRTDVDDIIHLSYDSDFRLKTVQDSVGQRTDILAYDPYGRPTAIRSLGVEAQIHYTVDGQIDRLAYGAHRVEFTFDANGRMTRRTDASGQYRQYDYDDAGRLIAESDNQGNRYTLAYDTQDRLLKQRFVSADEGVMSTLALLYDIEGRIVSLNDNGNIVNRRYEDHGKTVHVERERNKSYTTASSSTLSTTLANTTPLLTAKYNALGQLLQQGTIEYRYNDQSSDGQRQAPSTVIDAKGNATHYHRDDFGFLVAVESPETGTTHYQRDQAGNLTGVTTATGAQTHLHYDAANRLISAKSDDSEYHLSYNAQGRIEKISGGIETTSFDYTPQGQLAAQHTQIDGLSFTTGYEYTPQGQLLRKHLPNGVVLHHHYHEKGPKIGQLRAITRDRWIWDQVVLGELNTSNNSQEKTLTWGSGLQLTQHLNQRGQLERIDTNISSNASTNNTQLALRYEFDEQGNISGLIRSPVSTDKSSAEQWYRYDHAGRLAGIDSNQDGEDDYVGYLYDTAGNRLSETRANVVGAKDVTTRYAQTGSTDQHWQFEATFYEYDNSSNRLRAVIKQDSREEFTYNEVGSPLQKGFTSYQYNAQGRPITVFAHGEKIAEYAYNAWGERIKKTRYQKDAHGNEATHTTYYLYEDQRLVSEADEQGQITKHYFYHEARLTGLWQQRQFYSIVTDRRGAPMAVFNRQQQAVWSATYSPFGKANVNPDPDNDGDTFALNQRLPGQYLDDETGTHYNYLRDYDPSTGRYLTSDPSGHAGGINTYLYANANPLRYIDPLGLAPLSVSEAATAQTVTAKNSYVLSYRHLVIDCERSETVRKTINELQQFSPILYSDTVAQLINAPNSRVPGQTLPATDPRLQSKEVIRVYHAHDGGLNSILTPIALDEVHTLGQSLSPIGNTNNPMLLTITSAQDLVNIDDTLRQHFGKLVTDKDIELLKASLPSAYKTNQSTNEKMPPLVIDVEPLFVEIMLRFNTTLMTRPDVIAAEERHLLAQKAYYDDAVVHGELHCDTGQGSRSNDPHCATQTQLDQAYQSAAEHYQDTLKHAYEQLANSGYLPMLQRYYDQKAKNERLWQFAGSVTIAVVEIFVPLTVEELAIELGMAALGPLGVAARRIEGVGQAVKKIAKVADAIQELTTTRITSLSMDAARRINLIRYGSLGNYDHLLKLKIADPALFKAIKDAKLSDPELRKLNDDPQALAEFRQERGIPSNCVCGPRCFVAGTLISTRDGLKPIEQIKLGDLVATRSETNIGEISWQPVTTLFFNDDERITHWLHIENERGEQETYEVTDNHPFYVEGKGWVDVAYLEAGMTIPNDQGSRLTVIDIDLTNQSPATYNIEIAEHHTYFVGKLGAWAHNQNNPGCDCGVDGGEVAERPGFGPRENPRFAPYNLNNGNMIRTRNQAIELARSKGVDIPEDIYVGYINGWNRPDSDAEYFYHPHSNIRPNDWIDWDDFYHPNTGKIPVRFNSELLKSDEALVAHLAHEMHELNSLRRIFYENGGKLKARELNELIATRSQGGHQGNLHEQAWGVADELVYDMRSQ